MEFKEDDKYRPLRLENQLGFALYAAVHEVTKVYRAKLVPLGLTYPQYLVLAVLWEQDGIKISDIGQRLKLDSGTLTPLVRRLEKIGHIRRERSARDERVVRVFLRDKGRDIRENALNARIYVGDRLDMSQSSINKLRADLLTIVANLRNEDLQTLLDNSDDSV